MPRIKMIANDHDIHGKPLRYLGAILGTDITRDFRADIAEAIYSDHPCEDSCCDVAVAREEGFTYVAAHSLMGATECPKLEAVIAAHRFNRTLPAAFGSHMYDNADWEGWKAFHDEHGRECGSCGTFNYDDDDEQCGNCLAPMS